MPRTRRAPEARIRCHAKVNLGLRVVGARPDGHHEVRTILHTLSLHDTLEGTVSPSWRLDVSEEWSAEGSLPVPEGEGNLVLQAARSLEIPAKGRAVAFRLTKRIPAGSGLGSASSDAAGALLLVDRLLDLRLRPEDLHSAAASLGADVPFFLYGGAGLALGRGEEVYPLPDGPARAVVLAFPGVGLPTGEVYAEWDRLLTSGRNLSRVNDFAPWCLSLKGSLPEVRNDLEEAALSLRPSLDEIRKALSEAGAEAVSMSGSGSCFFALCEGEVPATRAVERLRQKGIGAVATRLLGRAAWARGLWERAAARDPR